MSTINNEYCTIGTQNNIQNNNVHQENYDEFNLPPTIRTFGGRESEFSELDDLFFNQKKLKVVIHGLPGFGKTELSKQYAKNCLEKNKIDHAFWIETEDAEKLEKSSRKLQKIYETHKDKRCLFIFDNSPNRQSLFECEPPENYFMLVTSPEKDFGSGVEPFAISSVSQPAAVDILKSILCEYATEQDSNLYNELVEAVYCVPLGIQIVGGYVHQRRKRLGHKFKFEDYIQEIRQQEEFIKKKFPTNISNPYKNSIYSALLIALNKIKQEDEEDSELAFHVLFVCAFLNPDSIDVDDDLLPTIQNKNASDDLNLAIALLANFSFVKHDINFITVSIHRLIQKFCRHYLHLNDLLDKYYTSCLDLVLCGPTFHKQAKFVLHFAEKKTKTVLALFKNNELQIQHKQRILHILVINGCVECTKTIFSDCPDTLNLLDPEFREFLVYTATLKNRQTEVFKLLFGLHGMSYWHKFKALNLCVFFKNTDAVKWLLEIGVDVNIRDENNNTVLHEAARDANLIGIQILTSNGADITAVNNNNETALALFKNKMHPKRRAILHLLTPQRN